MISEEHLGMEFMKWIHDNFTVFIGPSMSFFEIPINDGVIKRVNYITWRKTAETRVRLIQEATKNLESMLPMYREDQGPILFLRKGPVFYKDTQGYHLTFRISFWDDALQKRWEEMGTKECEPSKSVI